MNTYKTTGVCSRTIDFEVPINISKSIVLSKFVLAFFILCSLYSPNSSTKPLWQIEIKLLGNKPKIIHPVPQALAPS